MEVPFHVKVIDSPFEKPHLEMDPLKVLLIRNRQVKDLPKGNLTI